MKTGLRALLGAHFSAILLSSLVAATPDRPDAPAWLEKSNENSKVMTALVGRFNPEAAGQYGVAGYDEKVLDLNAGINERSRAATGEALDELNKRLLVETDPLVRQDLQILIRAAEKNIQSSLVNEKYLLPFTEVAKTIFSGEFALLQDQVDASRYPAALVRLKRYTGQEPGYRPLTELAQKRYEEMMAKDPGLLAPYKGEVEQALANTARMMSGIRDLYKKYKVTGGEPSLELLQNQLNEYDEWTRRVVLAGATSDFRRPEAVYADNLERTGLDINPRELIQKALVSYSEIRVEMQTIAGLIAKQRGWAEGDYQSVIHQLKKEQLDKDQIEPYYHGVITQIEEIIRREHIVTLPERAMIMRLASTAESAAQPAPHMRPPPLINNKGERGQFVLPLGNPTSNGDTSQTYDDFTYKAAAWTLTAHEGRPGHELQFSAMVERGVSVARSLFAFNSVNVEGWGLYSEMEAKPFEPLEGQLIALQLRLLRATRAFTDPMLNLGLMTRERAHDLLVNEVCLSEAFAREEVDRYTFRSPGQATAYFYGYQRIMELRASTEIKLGSKFNRQAFNDFLIGQGLLPPMLLAKAVESEFIPAQLAK